MAVKPDFIIVPGAWHSPEAFKPTSVLLEKAGYTLHGVPLASFGASPPLQNFDPDVKVIRDTVNKVLSSGKDVVIVYHSYGSVPGSEALVDYLKDLESKTKKRGWGNVQRLVFCCAFVLPEGGSLMAALQSKDLPWFIKNVCLLPVLIHPKNFPWLTIRGEKGDEVMPDTPEKIFYNDLSAEEAEPYISALKPHSYKTFLSQQSVAPWKVIPSTYIVCENDQAIPLPAQEGMLGMAHQMAPTSFDAIERCGASHSPFISQPGWLSEKLIKAAGGGA